MSWFARLFDGVGGNGGRAWAGSVEDLLYDGETVRRRVALGGDDRVVVTSHRLLAFTPGSDGENYRGVDLPNVTDVRAGHEGERNLLGIGGRTLVYGAVLLAVGVFVDFGAFVPTDAFQQTGAAGQLGMGGLLAMLQRFLDLVARIDEFARLIGAVLVLFAVFVFGVYLVTRDRVLVVGVAGDEEDVYVPASEDALDGAVADLEVALFDSGRTVDADGVEAGGVNAGGVEAGGAGADSVEVGETGVGASRTSDTDSDPLSPGSSAVKSEGITGSVESTADESDESVSEEVDRAVRETSGVDFSETVDEVVEGPPEAADPEEDVGDSDSGSDEGDATDSEFGFDA
ncbi:hypothetical protein [Halosimplex amylolyticum]|uniref:hypothetical protein n=1 Tax=Halosimplex amylolyticum TaxID=3396616 RepID=UPI003F55B46B